MYFDGTRPRSPNSTRATPTPYPSRFVFSSCLLISLTQFVLLTWFWENANSPSLRLVYFSCRKDPRSPFPGRLISTPTDTTKCPYDVPALSSEHKVIGIIVCHTVIVYFPNDIKISESLSSQRGNRGLEKAKRPGNVPQLAPESADKEASSGLRLPWQGSSSLYCCVPAQWWRGSPGTHYLNYT